MVKLTEDSTPASRSFGFIMNTILPSVLAVFALIVSTAFPMYMWYPNMWHCSTIDAASGSGDAECFLLPISVLLGAVISVFAHSTFVAIFAHSCFSAPLFRRSGSISTETSNGVKKSYSRFNTFLWLSIAFDVAVWGFALSYITTSEEFIQAIVITFNAPLLVFLPYLFAAMSEPQASDIGSWLHYLRTEVDARLLEKRQREMVDATASEQASLLSSPSSPRASQDEKAGWKMFAGV